MYEGRQKRRGGEWRGGAEEERMERK